MKYTLGTRVQKLDDNRVCGTVTNAIKWNNPDGYQGYVYIFDNRDRDGKVHYGYREDELEAANME